MKDRLFEIWFALRCGTGNTEFQAILDRFGTPYDVFNAEESELDLLPCSPRLKQALADKSLQESSQIMEYCRRNHIGILFWQDTDYPASLRPLRDPPVLLYYRGKLPELHTRLCISVVGTRSMSEYGKRMAYKIGYELASVGTVVISGMALGNDSVATAGAIVAGGSVVAVLGCGVDVVYPREHGHLYEEIMKQGAIVSEYPPGTPPDGRHFPVRNRIISGLSQGTVVVEGDLRSGALITARTAIRQGRDIYAFPGNVGETNTAGTNQLISDGAAVVLRARDVLENYTFLYRDTLHMGRLTRAEQNSEPDDNALVRLGVFTRAMAARPTESTAKQAPTSVPESTSRPTPPRYAKPAPKAAPKPAPKAAPPKAAEQGTTPPPAPKPSPDGDRSRRALAALNDTQRAIFEALPLDRAVPVDYLSREGFSMSQVMAAMTILEIQGLVVTLPGGLYARK